MPLYDYDCGACGRRFEVIHGVDHPPPERCPLCGSGPVRKAFAPPAIHFKGSGWAKKERRAAVKSGTKASEDGEKTSGDAAGGEGSKASEASPSGDPASTKSTPPTSSSTSTD